MQFESLDVDFGIRPTRVVCIMQVRGANPIRRDREKRMGRVIRHRVNKGFELVGQTLS